MKLGRLNHISVATEQVDSGCNSASRCSRNVPLFECHGSTKLTDRFVAGRAIRAGFSRRSGGCFERGVSSRVRGGVRSAFSRGADGVRGCHRLGERGFAGDEQVARPNWRVDFAVQRINAQNARFDGRDVGSCVSDRGCIGGRIAWLNLTKPLPGGEGLGWGFAATIVPQRRTPTPLRLGSKLPSLTAPPLKSRGEAQ